MSGHLSLGGGEEHFLPARHKTIAQKDSNDGSGEEERADNGVNNRGNHDGRHGLRIVGGNDARPKSDDAEKDLESNDRV